MDKKTKGMLLVVAAAFFIGTEAIFAKLVYGAGVNVITTITLRFTLASLIVLPILIITGHSLRIPPGRRGMMLGLILAYIIVAALLFQAFALLPASLAIMLLYAYPSFTALLSFMLDGELLSKEKILALVLSALGLVLLLWSSWNYVNIMGVLCALGAALANSFYFIYSSKMLRQTHQLTLTSWLFLSSALFYWTTGLFSGSLTLNVQPSAWLYLLGLSLVSTVLSKLALVYGLPLTGPTQAAIICTLEPPVTVLLAYFVFREVFTGVQILGALLILLAVILPPVMETSPSFTVKK